MNHEDAIARASALLDMRRPEEALQHLHAAVAAAPDSPELHCLIGHAELQLGHAEAALTAADAAVACGPDREWGHRVRAVVLLQLGRAEDARRTALEAARLEPAAAATHIVLASALQAAGDPDGAAAAAQHAIALDPEDADTHAALGEVLFAQDRADEAIDAFQRALEIDPEDAGALNNLAVARQRAYGIGGTRQFEAAARLDPRHEVARHNLLHSGPAGRGFVYRRLSVTLLVLAVVAAFGGPGSVLAFLAVAIALEFVRWLELGWVSEPTRQLVADDRRARRFQPQRWDWAWPLRLWAWCGALLGELLRPLRRSRSKRPSEGSGRPRT